MKIESIRILNPPCTLAYALWGSHSPSKGTVIAVHGLSRQKRDFDFVADYLSKNGYRVLSFDLPGRGDSSRLENPENYNYGVYTEIFHSVLPELGLNAVHWIGASTGGLIALEMAQKGYIEHFQSLTLVDITHQPNRAACRRIAGYVTGNLPVIKDIEQQVRFTKDHLPLGDVPENVWRHFAIHQFKKVDVGYTFHYDPKLMRRSKVDLLNPADLTEGLKKLNCPLALIAGGKSDLCTQDEIVALKKLRPDVRIHICPEAGHIPSLSDSDTQAFIGAFLSSANRNTPSLHSSAATKG